MDSTEKRGFFVGNRLPGKVLARSCRSGGQEFAVSAEETAQTTTLDELVWLGNTTLSMVPIPLRPL